MDFTIFGAKDEVPGSRPNVENLIFKAPDVDRKKGFVRDVGDQGSGALRWIV